MRSKSCLDCHVIGALRYHTASKAISRAIKGRPASAFDTALYWIEQVARNRPSPQKPSSPIMHLLLYLNVDLLLLIFTAAIICIGIFAFVIRMQLKCLTVFAPHLPI